MFNNFNNKRYPGSLTVPPCTEGIYFKLNFLQKLFVYIINLGIIWNVFKNPITISAESVSINSVTKIINCIC